MKSSKVKNFIKKFLFFRNSSENKKYFVIGLREKQVLSCLPKESTLLIARNFQDIFYALSNGYSFSYVGLSELSIYKAYFERNENLLDQTAEKVFKILHSNQELSFLISFGDTAPIEIISRCAAKMRDNNFLTICVQHGLLLNDYHENYFEEGSFSDYLLVMGSTQLKAAENIFEESLKVLNSGPMWEPHKVEEVGSLEVVLIAHGGGKIGKDDSQLAEKTFKRLSARLEKNDIPYVYRPHPDGTSSSSLYKSKLDVSEKQIILSGKPKVFVGFVSSLLYEAHLAGHTSVGISLEKDKSTMKNNPKLSFEPDYLISPDHFEKFCKEISQKNTIKKISRGELTEVPLKERLKETFREIELIELRTS